MNLTNPQRVRKLAADLLLHPGNALRDAQHNLWQRASPIDFGLPWFSYASIDFLAEFLRPDISVFEFGSRGSTIFFAQRCGSVVSLAQVRKDRYDIIVVDGADNDYTIRPRCFRVAEQQVKPGGIVVVDDSWRYKHLRSEHHARRVTIFESVGPARFRVSSTDVYFY